MTNGEKIMQAFPDLQIDMGELEVYMWTTTHDAIDIPIEWWNAEYKEPTTKNCRTCRNFGTHHGICEICKDNKCWTEKEPTADNDSADDCISRQAVLEQAYAYGNGLEPDGYCVNVEDIQALPSVTPQEKKGHWIPVFQGDEIIDYRCSCCEFGNTFGKGTVGMNYCPRCGSRNEVEE